MTATTSNVDIIRETLSKLGIGTPLNIGFNDVSQSVSSILIGMEFGKYIVITPPEPLNAIRTKLFQGNKIVIRYLYKGQVVAFPSAINDYITTPEHMVFVNYPKKLIQQNIRSAKRVDCLIPAVMNIEEREVKLVITDISQKGCGIMINLEDEENLPELSLNSPIILKSEYLLGNSDLDLAGMVRNARKKKGKLYVGIQFSDLHEKAKHHIDSYNNFLKNYTL